WPCWHWATTGPRPPPPPGLRLKALPHRRLDRDTGRMTRGWKIAFLAVLAIGAIGLAYYLRAVFLPLLVALLLSYVLNPVLGWLERRKVPRKASIAGVYVVLLGVMALVAFVAVPAAFGE